MTQDPAKATVSEPGTLRSFVDSLIAISIRALARMYRPERKLYAFRIRPNGDDIVLEGVSRRYTSIVLIGLAEQTDKIVQDCLPVQSPEAVLNQLGSEVHQWENLGDTALLLWATRAWGHSASARAMKRLEQLDPVHGCHPTVELAWALMAVSQGEKSDSTLPARLADRLMRNFNDESKLFPHYPDGMHRSLFRSHVTCFADWVYPVMALSQYAKSIDKESLIRKLNECAARICALQGPAGQWWWHYDVRTCRVIERFPVYAVHQNSMGPMALFALQEAGGDHNRSAIHQSLRWLRYSPEIRDSLVDQQREVIWRKVARKEPGKLARGLQAFASSLHSSLRFPWIDKLLPPTWVDYESRPYHMGWVLYTWTPARVSELERGTLQDCRRTPVEPVSTRI